jgi:hypothetical protein
LPNTVEAELHSRRLSRSIVKELDQFALFLEAKPGFFLVCFSIVYFIGALGAAYNRKLWLDEIITAYITALPTITDIWNALVQTTDGNPPLYYLLARPLLGIFNETMAIRLPAVIGFWVACLCLFSFVRRHTSTVAASVAVLIFAETGAFRWAVEGRPYAVVLGLAGVALVCWQKCADQPRYRVPWLCTLGLTIAGLVSTHYYSGLLVIPLLIGELVRFFQRRRLDWPVCAVIAIGSASILFWLPLIRGLRNNIAGNAASANYFAKPTLPALYEAYATLVNPIIIPCLVYIALGVLWLRKGARAETRDGTIAAEATAVTLGFAFFPILTYLVALYVTHTFVLRYVLAGAMGIGILAGFFLHLVSGVRHTFAVLVLLIGYSYFNYTVLPLATASDDTYRPALDFLSKTDSTLPIVVPEGLLFAPLWHDAPASLRSRLFYLLDMATAEKTTDTTNENIMLRLKPQARDGIMELNEFTGHHKMFLLYYYGVSANSSLESLLKRKCNVMLAEKSGSQLLFRCECNSPK